MRKKRSENRVYVEPTGVAVPFPVFSFGKPLRFMVGPTEIDLNIGYWQERLRSSEIRIVTSAEIKKRESKKPKLTEVEKKLDADFVKTKKQKKGNKK